MIGFLCFFLLFLVSVCVCVCVCVHAQKKYRYSTDSELPLLGTLFVICALQGRSCHLSALSLYTALLLGSPVIEPGLPHLLVLWTHSHLSLGLLSLMMVLFSCVASCLLLSGFHLLWEMWVCFSSHPAPARLALHQK